MADPTGLGDVIGNRIPVTSVSSHAAVASNGAGARLDTLGPFPFDIRVRNAWWNAISADMAINTASYRRMSLYNGGATGTVTATASRMASLNITASVASFGASAFTVLTAVTAASGEILYFSQETVGGDHNAGTALPTGQFSIAYEII